MTDHWEHVTWSRSVLDVLTNQSTISLQWFLDGTVAKVSLRYIIFFKVQNDAFNRLKSFSKISIKNIIKA